MSTDPSELGADQQVPAEDPAEGTTSETNIRSRDMSQAEGDDDETAEDQG